MVTVKLGFTATCSPFPDRSAGPKAVTPSPHSIPIRSHMECSDVVGALDSRGARSILEDRLSLTVAILAPIYCSILGIGPHIRAKMRLSTDLSDSTDRFVVFSHFMVLRGAA